MNIKFDETFYKDLKKLKNKEIASRLKKVITEIEKVGNISEIRNIKKLEGYPSYYRIRIGDYRIGLEIENETTIVFIRFKHRKEIYNYFQ